MNTEELTRAARRVLSDRLGRLRGSLEDLGGWFRENVAQLIGRHVGEAVRDALAAALGRPEPRGRYAQDEDDESGFDSREPYHSSDDEGDSRDFWGRHETYQPRREQTSEPKRDHRRWDALLATLAQVGSWWLRKGMPRASLGRVLALGAAAGVVTLLLGPLAGGLLATAGTALLAAAPLDLEPNTSSR